ncbi:hypothetical protein [Escherichia phage UPWr_E1]
MGMKFLAGFNGRRYFVYIYYHCTVEIISKVTSWIILISTDTSDRSQAYCRC